MPIRLSVILITRNEAHNVAGCLASVAFADEWIVVDSGSTDGTCDIAERFGATVVRTDDWPGFGAQKHRALDKVRAGQRGGLASALSHGLWAFVRCYLVRRGFLDGRLGFVLAVYVAEGTYYRYLKMGLLARPATLNQPAKTGS